MGYFAKITDIPSAIVHHIKTVLHCSADTSLKYKYPQTLSRHKKTIRTYLGVTPFNQKAKNQIKEIIKQSSLRMDNPADLINVAIEQLIKERYELLGFYTLDRLVSQTRKEVNQQLFFQVVNQLSSDYIERLNTLLDNYASVERSPLNDLKKFPQKSSRNHLNDLIIHLTWLETLGEVKQYLKPLTPSKSKHFARLS